MRLVTYTSFSDVVRCNVLLLLAAAADAQSRTATHAAREQLDTAEVFPADYPSLLRAVYLLAREKASGPSQASDITETIKQARDRVGEAEYQNFLQRFGLNPKNREDIKLCPTSAEVRLLIEVV
jgi:hypothetical protein